MTTVFEPMEIALLRASKRMSQVKPYQRVAFYFLRGKLFGSTEGNRAHETRLKEHAAMTIGTYAKGCGPAILREDLEYFYTQICTQIS